MKLARALLLTATMLSAGISPAFASGAYILTGVPPPPPSTYAASGAGPHHYPSHHFGYSQPGGLGGDALVIGLVAVVLGLGIWFGRCHGSGKKEQAHIPPASARCHRFVAHPPRSRRISPLS